MIFPDAPTMNWKEADLQKAVATFLFDLERLGLLTFHHSPNEGNRHVSHKVKLKSHGMRAGEPDIAIYIKGGKTVFVELKTMTGKISANQLERSRLLGLMGFKVYTVLAETPKRAVDQVHKILRENGVSI